jgi:hypothetical protein
MGKLAVLFGGTALVFLITLAIMLRLMPKPMRDTDYLVVGAVATLVAMLTLFVVLIRTTMKAPDTFGKRRPKGTDQTR